MKTKLTILLLFVISSLSAQDYEPITVVVSSPLKINKQTTLQKGDSITLIKPRYSAVGQVGDVSTSYGTVDTDRLKWALSGEESNRYWNWVGRVKAEEKPKLSEFEAKQDRLQASMKMMSKTNTWHDYLTVFTGELEFNFSHLRLLDFLAEVMKMSEVSNDYEGNYIVSKCVQRTSKGNPEQLTIRYKVRAENGYFFPETVEITGTSRKVIELFISYWPSKIQYDDTKKGVQYDCYYTPDKVTLSIDKAGKAKINIVNSQK